MSKHYNPERRAWRGRSYKKWGARIAKVRERARLRSDRKEI